MKHVPSVITLLLSFLLIDIFFDFEIRNLGLLVLLYGCGTWTVKARNARRITAAEMRYMRRTAEYIWTDTKQIHKLQRS